ncbi:hypothetical protein LRC537489_40270 [Mycobacterium riyadhense]
MCHLEGDVRPVRPSEVDDQPVVDVNPRHPAAVDEDPVRRTVVDCDPARLLEPQQQVHAVNQGVRDAQVGVKITPDRHIRARREAAL